LKYSNSEIDNQGMYETFDDGVWQKVRSSTLTICTKKNFSSFSELQW